MHPTSSEDDSINTMLEILDTLRSLHDEMVGIRAQLTVAQQEAHNDNLEMRGEVIHHARAIEFQLMSFLRSGSE